jgi:hypothetical protein
MTQIPNHKLKKVHDLHNSKHEHKQIEEVETTHNYNNINNLIEKYIFYLQYEKNVSPKTIENYSLWLNRFSEYIGDMDVEKLKSMHALDFRIHLKNT